MTDRQLPSTWTDQSGEIWDIIEARESHGVMRVFMERAPDRTCSLRWDYFWQTLETREKAKRDG